LFDFVEGSGAAGGHGLGSGGVEAGADGSGYICPLFPIHGTRGYGDFKLLFSATLGQRHARSEIGVQCIPSGERRSPRKSE
jgi:hypothetical protein